MEEVIEFLNVIGFNCKINELGQIEYIINKNTNKEYPMIKKDVYSDGEVEIIVKPSIKVVKIFDKDGEMFLTSMLKKGKHEIYLNMYKEYQSRIIFSTNGTKIAKIKVCNIDKNKEETMAEVVRCLTLARLNTKYNDERVIESYENFDLTSPEKELERIVLLLGKSDIMHDEKYRELIVNILMYYFYKVIDFYDVNTDIAEKEFKRQVSVINELRREAKAFAIKNINDAYDRRIEELKKTIGKQYKKSTKK